MSHCLILQAKGKPRRAFGLVKERIVTTQPCSVVEEVQQGGQCGAGLGFCELTNPRVRYQDLLPCHIRCCQVVAEGFFSRLIIVNLEKSAGVPEGQCKFAEGQ